MAAGHMVLHSKEALESMSRRELQALAKKRRIIANSKSAVIIEEILTEQLRDSAPSGKSRSEEELRELDCHVHFTEQLNHIHEFEKLVLEHARVMASMTEALAKYAEIAPVVISSLSNKTVLRHYESVEKRMTSTIHQMFESAVNRLSPPPDARKKKVKSVAPHELPKVSVKTAVVYLPIFVKGVPGTVVNDKIQTVFNTKALVGRFKSGHCKVLVPESELDRALSQNFVSGHKICVKKWRAHEDYHRNGRQHRPHDRNREVSNIIETCMKTMKRALKPYRVDGGAKIAK